MTTRHTDTGKTADLQTRLHELLDRADIQDVMKRYTRGIKKGDAAMVASCFTVDARLESNGQSLRGTGEIERYYAEWFQATATGGGGFGMQRVLSTPYMAADVEITLDGDRATAHSSGLAVHMGRRGEGELVVIRGAFYDDDFLRTPSGWRISRRFHGNHWVAEVPARMMTVK